MSCDYGSVHRKRGHLSHTSIVHPRRQRSANTVSLRMNPHTQTNRKPDEHAESQPLMINAASAARVCRPQHTLPWPLSNLLTSVRGCDRELIQASDRKIANALHANCVHTIYLRHIFC